MQTEPPSPTRLPAASHGHRPDLGDRALLRLVGGAALLLVAYFAALPFLPADLRATLAAPGSAVLQSAAIAGSLLLLVAFVFVLVKRTGRGGSPVRWFGAHVVCATAGAVLVAAHSTGTLDRPPALLLVAIAALVALGVWARVRLSGRIAATFGAKQRGFRPLDAAARERLAAVIDEKRRLLPALDPAADEGTFSVTLRHQATRPLLARRYARLAAEEARLIGARQSVPVAQAWWRLLHIALAWGFVVGLIGHVVVVTFFAGYVAEGREIYWWHVADWNF